MYVPTKVRYMLPYLCTYVPYVRITFVLPYHQTNKGLSKNLSRRGRQW